MPEIRVVPTSEGFDDRMDFEFLKPGDCFVHVPGNVPLSMLDDFSGEIVWLRTDGKLTAVSIDKGRTRTFRNEDRVLLLRQRNMWEMWI